VSAILRDLLVRQFPVHPVHHPAHAAGVDEEHLAAAVAEASILLVAREEPQARGDLGGVKELVRQGHHAVHQVGLDQVLADLALARLVRGHGAIGQHEARHARGCQVVHDVLHPGEVGIAHRWHAVLPALVLPQALPAPVGDVEGGIGQDEVGLEIGEAVVVEGVAVGDLALDAADREVHLRKPPSGVVRLLTVDGDVGFGLATIAVPAGVRTNELHRLHEHAGRAAAGVVNAAAVGLEHLDKKLHHAARGVELAALLALGAGELREKVFVHTTEHVLGAAFLIADFDVADEVDQLAEAGFVERGAGVVLGQHALEGRVVAFDGGHGVVHQLADGGLLGLGFEVRPARLGGTQKMFSARYSSGSSGSAYGSCSRRLRCSSKASEIYLRKIRPSTTCLYSAASIEPRRASAICQSCAS
jgi:hypothetical protein